MVYPQPDTPDLSQIKSEAIRTIAEMAIADGNEAISLAEWSKALVAHMRDGLTDALKAKIAARWPALEYYSEDGSPHNEPDEGYIDGAFAISFPRPR
ncbi:MAG: hypothetical protein CVT79_16770 [Alphaproteobacteria bacterium HGW-Alphaproteobacteria-18]|nr:MAG: hypothetical protein CVT79_16770 [Alphaproteobacteria bacterium HGW-Alphaproteobacteria-18]